MKKTILFLVLILIFSYPSVQANMEMRITSEQARSDEKSADADNEETKEATEVIETTDATETIAITETIGAIKATEVITAVETKEIEDAIEAKVATEIGLVDYKSLGLRSVELNPNEYPDEVIALLESHKDNKNNKSVLFYSSLGLAYKSKGRLKDAIAAYKRALELVSSVPAPAIQYNLGIAYYYNNEFHKSFNCFLNSSAQRSDHPGTKKWIKHLAGELNIYKVPDTSKLKLVVNQKMSINRKKTDRESRLRIYLTEDGGRIQELSVKDKIYSYGIDSDTERPVDYIIIDNDGDGDFDKVISTKGKFGVPTWAYNPD
jgi:tetratricopeptide (TPR) repeat protein